MARELVQVISPASGDLESADHSSHSAEPFPNFYIFVGAVAVVIVLMIVIILCWKLFKTEDVMKDLKQSKAKQASQELWSGNLRTVNYFDFQTLKKATRNFNSAYFLGRGGFGPVYRGKLPDGRLVAIKKLSLGKSLQGESEFVSEVRMITSIQHKNLVQLLGCCVDGPQRLLVYEYMKNRSLDLIVNGKSNQCLDWNTRFQIILGIARGLQYLHEDSQLRIVHRDIKASNILLDDKFQPRIGDFGLARFFPEDQAYLSTTFAGTLGYTAPEYAIRGELSEKADIYSFGVLVLEIISCRKNTDLNLPTEMQYLPEYAWRLHERSRVKEIVDPRLQHGNGTIDRDIMLVIHVAFLCLQPHANLRPPMSQIVAMLTCKVSPVGSPLRPTFLERRRRLDENLSWDTISEAFPSIITTMSNESPPTPS